MTDWCWLPWPGRGRSNSSQVSRRRVVARMEGEILMENRKIIQGLLQDSTTLS